MSRLQAGGVFVAVVSLVVTPLAGGRVAAVALTSATGARVKVMTIGDFGQNPEWPGAVEARLEATNARGGIKDASGVGHQVEVIVCDSGFDLTRTQACARQAVDKGVAAVVGMTSVDSDGVWPTLEAAGIPVIGARINTATDATSPVSFPLGSGMPGLLRGMPRVLALQGATRVAVIISDFGDATNGVVSLIGQGIQASGVTEGPVVLVPRGTRDLAPYVARAVPAGVDGVIGFLVDQGEARLLVRLDKASFTGRNVTQASLLTDFVLTKAGKAAEGTLVVGEFAPFSANVRGIRLFRKDMLDHDPALQFNEGALNAWLAAWVFERVARGLPSIDAASVLAAMRQIENLDMGGVTPPLRTTTVEIPDAPKLFNPTVTFNKLKNGEVKAISKRFYDPFTGEFVPAVVGHAATSARNGSRCCSGNPAS